MAIKRMIHVPAFAVISLAPLAVAHADPSLAMTSHRHDFSHSVCDLAAPPDYDEHAPAVDCSESTDTGYMSGNAFTITVVHIDGKPVEKASANAYWVMREAAAAAGVDMHINSGFRTMAEQEYFWNCYQTCSCNSCNQAAAPGYSNHQSGHAFDINTATPGVYNWLAANGGAFGFTETVPGEPWHWEWWGGGPGGGICDISIPPQGYLDKVDCEEVWGWAQDPDEPDAAIDVHVYFNAPAGDPAGIGVSVTADEHREDLCTGIGSCAHGYTVAIPPSLRDNQMHAVHVYGIDIEGQDNSQLAQSPTTFKCPPPALPPGVRRHIVDPAVLMAWKFDLLWDLVNVDDPTLLAIAEWKAIQPAPLLMQADDGSPEVWLKDGSVRRHVTSPEVADNWGFDLATVVSTPAAEVYAIPVGTPLWDKPVLVKGSGPELYQLDDVQCLPSSTEPECQIGVTIGDDPSEAPTGSGGSESGDPGGSSGSGETDDGGGTDGALPPGHGATGGADDASGCACAAEPSGSPLAGLGLLVLGALGRRRRRG